MTSSCLAGSIMETRQRFFLKTFFLWTYHLVMFWKRNKSIIIVNLNYLKMIEKQLIHYYTPVLGTYVALITIKNLTKTTTFFTFIQNLLIFVLLACFWVDSTQDFIQWETPNRQIEIYLWHLNHNKNEHFLQMSMQILLLAFFADLFHQMPTTFFALIENLHTNGYTAQYEKFVQNFKIKIQSIENDPMGMLSFNTNWLPNLVYTVSCQLGIRILNS